MKVKSDIEHIAIKVDIGHTISFKNTCQITSFQVYHSFVVLSDLWILSYVECVGRRLETEAHYSSTSYVTPNRVCTRAATKPSSRRVH